jgi:hypothetical protein
MSLDKPSPAAAKQRIMGDLKQVSSEKWVQVDVRAKMASLTHRGTQLTVLPRPMRPTFSAGRLP